MTADPGARLELESSSVGSEPCHGVMYANAAGAGANWSGSDGPLPPGTPKTGTLVQATDKGVVGGDGPRHGQRPANRDPGRDGQVHRGLGPAKHLGRRQRARGRDAGMKGAG